MQSTRPSFKSVPARGFRTNTLLLLLALSAGGLALAPAQLNPATVRRINNDLANDAVSAVEVFSAANTIATGVFAYDNPGPDDVEFQTYKLPFTHGFGRATNQLRPFAEGYVGYFDLHQDVNGFGPPPGEIQIRSVTATAGGGVAWQVNRWLSATPRMLFAYTHAWQDFERNAPPGDPFANLITDWEVDSLTLLPSLEINAAGTLGRWDFGFNTRFTYIRVLGWHDTSPLIDLDSKSQVWRNEISASYRAPWQVFDLWLRPFGLFARHDVAGQIQHSGFVDYFYEARLGLGLSTPQWLHPIRELNLSGAYYFQGAFTGYSIGLGFDF